MKHLKTVLLAVLLITIFSTEALAQRSRYVATNRRFNYIKLRQLNRREAREMKMTHPAQIDARGLRSALESLMLSRSYVIRREVDSQRVFDDASLDFLAHNMAQAFAQAEPNEKVVFSYLMKNPIFILRNDRLNLGDAWIDGDNLHIKFKKLYAKVTGDTDKRGGEARAIARARGLRVVLELQPGQMMAVGDPEEVILNLHHNYAADVQQRRLDDKVEPVVGRTMAGEEVPLPAAEIAPAGPVVSADVRASAEEAALAAEEGSTEQRLRKLDQLRKDGLISSREYRDKKKEILKDL